MALAAWGAPRARAASGADPPRVAAVRAASAIEIDGRLDEKDWERAGVIADLTQHTPHPGEPTPYRTEVRVLTDGSNLFVGVRCFDPDPSKITLHSMQRDIEDPFGDDFITLILDTYGDHRTAYFFDIHATGSVTDGLVPGPGLFSTDWDGIWEARTRIEASGWTAEIRIPSRTLHFKRGLKEWGFNVYRYVARDRLSLHWSGVTIDADLLDLSTAGVLSGLEGLDQGRGLTVAPYLLSRYDHDRTAGDETTVGRGGLDVTYSLTPSLVGVVTAKTDFAETEVDTRQINLTRFDLFFPEKRSFFLEGSSLFDFGLGLGQDFVPFYSRRIGLVDGLTVPIDWGAKVLGHAGRVGIAALDIRTEESPAAQRADLGAARVTWSVTDRFRVGALGTRGNPEGGSDNTLTGLDAVWHSSSIARDKKLSIGGWAARTGGAPAPGRRDGWGVAVDYPNDFWNAYVHVMEFGDALDPALGFLPRPGTRKYDLWNALQPRPDRDGPFGFIRQAFFETEFTQVDGLDGRTQSRRLFTAPFNIETESGEHFEADWVPIYEFLPEDFNVAGDVVVPAGKGYHFTRFRVEAQSAKTRRFSVGTTDWLGGFYGGRLTQTEAYVTWDVLGGHLHQKLDLENDFGRLPEGDFIQRLFQLQNVYAFSPRLLLFGYFQYDTESRETGMNARLRWTFRPGNDLFVVWNRNWVHPVGEGPFDLDPARDQITVKVRFAWTG